MAARPRLAVERGLDLREAADVVWRVIGDFGALGAWMPGVSAVFVRGFGIGAARTCETALGRFEEQLEEIGSLSCGYTILSGPLPVSGYRATLGVLPSSARSCRVTWSSRFDPAEGTDDETAIAAVASVYEAGLSGMARLFGARADRCSPAGEHGSRSRATLDR